jgi:hypothetical protein
MHDTTFFDDGRDDEAGVDADSLTEIARYTATLDAQVLAGCLEASGIPVFMGNFDTANALGYMGAAVPIVLRVPTRQLDEARAVIAAFERGEFALDEDADYGDAE